MAPCMAPARSLSWGPRAVFCCALIFTSLGSEQRAQGSLGGAAQQHAELTEPTRVWTGRELLAAMARDPNGVTNIILAGE